MTWDYEIEPNIAAILIWRSEQVRAALHVHEATDGDIHVTREVMSMVASSMAVELHKCEKGWTP